MVEGSGERNFDFVNFLKSTTPHQLGLSSELQLSKIPIDGDLSVYDRRGVSMKFAVLCLLLLFPLVVKGVTISATVDCGSGPIGGIGVSSVSCTGANNVAASASGSLRSLGDEVSAEVAAEVISPSSSGMRNLTADASFEAGFVVTITGGTGVALELPCVYATGDLYPGSGGQATASAVLGPASASSNVPITSGSCGTERGIPFTFGTPFVLFGEFSVSADSPGPLQGGPAGTAGTSGQLDFEVTDFNGVLLPHSATVSIVPEPDTWRLMLLPVVLILVQVLRGKCRIAL